MHAVFETIPNTLHAAAERRLSQAERLGQPTAVLDFRAALSFVVRQHERSGIRPKCSEAGLEAFRDVVIRFIESAWARRVIRFNRHWDGRTLSLEHHHPCDTSHVGRHIIDDRAFLQPARQSVDRLVCAEIRLQGASP